MTQDSKDIFPNVKEEEFLNGLKILVSLDEEKQFEFLKLIRNIVLDKNIKFSYILSLLNDFKIHMNEFRDLINAVIIILYANESEYKNKLLPLFQKVDIDENIQQKIKKFPKEFYSFFQGLNDREEIEKFGIPYFSSIDLITDYRILNTSNNERELIPIILGKINLKDGEMQKDLSFLFQFSLADLDNILSHLHKFRENIIKDNSYLESKIKGGNSNG